MKIYNVICEITNDYIHSIVVDTFLNEDKATTYFKRRTQEIKEQYEKVGLESYCIDDEDKDYYEIYLDGRKAEDSTTIWISDDETCDESVE